MDLLLRGRGPDISARAPAWLIRSLGAVLAFGSLSLADRLGFSLVTGFSAPLLRLGVLIFGALIAPTVAGAVLWWITGALVVVSMLIAFTPVVRAPASHFVRRDTGNETVDAVVVLSGWITDDGLLLSPQLDRLLGGIAEARRRGVSAMALSVIAEGTGQNLVTSETDQRELMKLLAPDLTVRFVHDVASTRDEALMFAALSNTYHWHRVAVVTSPLHSRRACRTFEVAGLNVSCAPSESREYSLTRLRGADARLNVFRDMMYEIAATTLYRVRGWN